MSGDLVEILEYSQLDKTFIGNKFLESNFFCECILTAPFKN